MTKKAEEDILKTYKKLIAQYEGQPIALITTIKYDETLQKFKTRKTNYEPGLMREFKMNISSIEKKLPQIESISKSNVYILILILAMVAIVLIGLLVEDTIWKIVLPLICFLTMITAMSRIYQKRKNLKEKRNNFLLKMVNDWNLKNKGISCCHFHPGKGGVFNLYKIEEITWRARNPMLEPSLNIKRATVANGSREILCKSDIHFLENINQMNFCESQLINDNSRLESLKKLDEELKQDLGFPSNKNSNNFSFFEPDNLSFNSKEDKGKENKAETLLLKPVKNNFKAKIKEGVINESVVDLESEKDFPSNKKSKKVQEGSILEVDTGVAVESQA